MLTSKKMVKGITVAVLACGIWMVCPSDSEAAISARNVKYGAGETLKDTTVVPVQKPEPVSQESQLEVKDRQPVAKDRQPVEANSRTVDISKEMEVFYENEPEAENQVVEPENHALPVAQQDVQHQIDAALIVSLEDTKAVYDVSGYHVPEWINQDAVHKQHYAFVCRQDRIEEFERAKQVLRKLDIDFKEVKKEGQIPAEVEKDVCNYLGSEDIAAIVFKFRDPSKPKEKSFGEKALDIAKSFIPFGLGNLF